MSDFEKENPEDKYCIFVILGMLELPIEKVDHVCTTCYFTYDEKIILLTTDDPEILFKHKHYLSDYDIDQGFLFLFDVPKQFIIDYYLFIKGEYSKLSKKLQENMSKYAKLDIPKKDAGVTFTHNFGYIIAKHPLYIKELEEYFGIKLPKNNELAEPPKNFNFAVIEDFFKEELEEQ